MSLCLIVGNVAEYIERCLTSFAPIADEIILVRAIGNREPDQTFPLAEALCSRLGIPLVTGVYQNAPGHEDWPHVDSFAAARQKSFDLASGDYCFWCDTDDVLKSGVDLIRQHAIEALHPVYIFPYEIFGRDVTVPRERMIRRVAGGSWKYPVHECYTFPETVEGGSDERIVVQHLPHPSKSGSMERNLRILESIPQADMTPGLWYHLHCELRGAGRTTDSINAAKKALEHPDLGRPERYELLLNMATMCENLDAGCRYLIAAFGTDPCRREALGLLATTAIDMGNNAAALAYARQMIATRRPDEWSWNDRSQAYGWIGNDIYQQALRANGLKDDAEKVRLTCLMEATTPRISLLHASRGRARKASGARKMWMDLAEHPEAIEHIFAIDEDDASSFALRRFHHVVVPAGGGCVAAWNAAAALSTGDILIQLSDDWVPPAKWDTLILQRLGDLRIPKVLAVSDGHRTDDLLCIAILTRARYLDQGYLFHPEFKSVFSDNWFTHTARRDSVLIDARDLIFEHMHPAAGKGELDLTYAQSNSQERYREGEATFRKLLARVECWQDIPGWFNFADLYQWIAQSCRDGDILIEIGCWKGRSINYLASACKALGKRPTIIVVDTFRGESGQPAHEGCGYFREEFERNLKACGNDDIVSIMENDSADAAGWFSDGGVFAVFLDAGHEYDAVHRDLTAWIPKVRADGILAGHDYHHEPVKRAVDELLPAACAASGTSWIDTARRSDFDPRPPSVAGLTEAGPQSKTGNRPILSILTPAIWQRSGRANELNQSINGLILDAGAKGKVEHLVLFDNLCRSVGAKRQALLDSARGDYIAFVDDDDAVSPEYVQRLLTAAESGVDVITFRQEAIIDGERGEIIFDATHAQDEPWTAGGIARRPPWHVCAWRRDVVAECVFPDISYGEDHQWSLQARLRMRTHLHIDEVLHSYIHSKETTAAPPPR